MDHYEKIHLAGYDRIILQAVELSRMDESFFLTARQLLENGPIKCRALNGFSGSDLKLCGPAFNVLAIREYSRVLIKRSSLLGVEYIGVGAPQSRNIPEHYSYEKALDELKQSLSIICSEAAPFGISILLEPVCTSECNIITNTNEAYDLLTSLALDNLHLNFDTYHAAMMGEDAKPLQRAINEVKRVHVAQSIDNVRRCPQKGFAEAHKVYFDTLLANGYTGEISVEANLTGADGELTGALRILKTLCGEPA